MNVYFSTHHSLFREMKVYIRIHRTMKLPGPFNEVLGCLGLKYLAFLISFPGAHNQTKLSSLPTGFKTYPAQYTHHLPLPFKKAATRAAYGRSTLQDAVGPQKNTKCRTAGASPVSLHLAFKPVLSLFFKSGVREQTSCRGIRVCWATCGLGRPSLPRPQTQRSPLSRAPFLLEQVDGP